MFKKAIGFCMALALTLSCVQPAFAAETEVTGQPAETAITITNNVGTPDTVKVDSVKENDVVKVYSTDKDTNPLTMGVVIGESTTSITMYVNQLGASAGKVYVTVTSASKSESTRTMKDYAAETQTGKLSDANIDVLNNVTGEFDRIDIKSGIKSGDIVRVYTSASAATPIATTVSGGTSASLFIGQLGAGAGSVFVSFQESGKLEGERFEKKYDAEKGSTELVADNITVVNNYKIKDTVTVDAAAALKKDDVVNVYTSLTATTPLGTGKASADNAAVAIELELGAAAGTAYVAVKAVGSNESKRTAVKYDSETTAAPDITKDKDIIKVTNNYGASDTVVVSGLAKDDVIKVYTTANSATPVEATAAEADGKYTATATLELPGTGAGKIYVTLTKKDRAESTKVTVAYGAEPTSSAIDANNIIPTNNATGTADTVVVKGSDVVILDAGDVLKVYKSLTDKVVLNGTEGAGTTVTADDATAKEVTISITQLGTAAGKVYVTITKKDKLESPRTAKEYSAEDATPQLAAEAVTVVNNDGTDKDTITVGTETNKLAEGDVVRVYMDNNAKTAAVKEVTVAKDKTSVEVTGVTLTKTGGKIYVTVQKDKTNESTRTAVSYESEITAQLKADTVEITNNYGANDTIKFTGLSAGDTVKVYKLASGDNKIDEATVADGKDFAEISAELPTSAAGKIYVSLTKKDKTESARVAVSYKVEPTTDGPSKIDVKNNITGTDDIVQVDASFVKGDIIKVYRAASGNEVLKEMAVTEDTATSVTISITQLGVTAGKVYVTVTQANKLESERIPVAYTAETPTKALDPKTAVTIVNNAGTDKDTITVTGLKEGDVVNVYADTKTTSTYIETATVAKDGNSVEIKTAKLVKTGGKVYISLKNSGANESGRIAVSYDTEISAVPKIGTVTNNYVGTKDKIVVKAVDIDDIVTVYNANEKIVKTATAKADLEVEVDQLGITAGKVYVTLTKKDKAESAKVTVSYKAEPVSTFLKTYKVETNNIKGSSDTVTVTGLTKGDIVKVYTVATGGTSVDATADDDGKATATLDLGSKAGRVYITIQRANEHESTRTAVSFTTEVTVAPTAANIMVMNNPGEEDSVIVSGLKAGDLVTVYDDKGVSLNTATVADGKTGATVNVKLNTTAGKVLVSVTGKNKDESVKVAKTYIAE